MALFKNKGNSLSRANAILDKHKLHGEQETTEVAEEVAEEVVETKAEQEETTEVTKEVVEEVVEQETTETVEEEVVNTEEVTEEEVENKKEPVSTDPPELTDEVVLSYLSEKLNRKIESVDDLTPKEKEIDPEVAQLLEWKEKTGLSLSKFSDYNKDYSTLSDLDVAREILSQKNPNFTQEELSYKLNSYVFDEDIDEESDKIRKSIALKEFAQSGRLELEKNKVSLKEHTSSPNLTQEQQDNLTFAEQVKGNIKQSQIDQKAYNENLNDAALALTGLDLKLSDELTINFDIPDGDKKTLSDSISKMSHWQNEDGSLNHKTIAEDGVKVLKFDSIMEQVYQQGVAVGKEEIISGKTKTDLKPRTEDQGGGEPKKGNIHEVVANLGGNKKGKLRFGNRGKKK